MRAIGYSTAAVLVLVGLYLALGGASYAFNAVSHHQTDLVIGALLMGGCLALTRSRSWAAAVCFGLASCEMYGRLSVLDLILPFALAREPIIPGLFAELGYGGLLQQTFAARHGEAEPADEES